MAKKIKQKPSFDREHAIVERYGGPVAGVDEAGRGPLAGPVVAAAVAFSEAHVREGLATELGELNDSKALGQQQRQHLCSIILRVFRVGIGIANRQRIDRDNILRATLWAMRVAIDNLDLEPTCVLIDGNKAPQLKFRTETIIGGDRHCLSIAAASIVAKVARDEIMCNLAAVYPQYGFEQHKGYPTRGHLEAIARHGICYAHRRSFRPVRQVLKPE